MHRNAVLAAYLALLCILLLCAAHTLFFWPRLPEEVASHFAFDGTPNGHSSRGEFVALTMGINLLVAILIGTLAATIRYIPNSMINLPNKAYWLHEERRETALANVQFMLLVVAATTAVFLQTIFHLICTVNMQAELSPLRIYVPLGIFLAAISLIIAWSFWRFRLPTR